MRINHRDDLRTLGKAATVDTDTLDRYEVSGPTEETRASGGLRRIYLLTNKDQPSITRRVVRELGPGDDFWYTEGIPFFAQHKSAYYTEAVKRAVTGAIGLPFAD